MAYIQLNMPDALSMNEALDQAFAKFNCEPLGGPSEDGWSGVNDLQRCPYRYYLKKELGAVAIDPMDNNLRIRNPQALEVGGLFHAVLAVHYGRRLPKGYPGWRENMPNPIDFLQAVEETGATIAHVREVKRLYYSYSEFWGPELDIQPLAVEMGAGIPGIHTCRFDMLMWEDGGIWNCEHKTASAFTPDVMESWWLDGEVIGQFYAWDLSEMSKMFGAPLTGTKINLTSKGSPSKHARIEIVQPREVVSTFARDRLFWNDLRARYRNSGYWPRSLAGCMNRYDKCAFWTHCRDLNNDLVQIMPKKVVSALPGIEGNL